MVKSLGSTFLAQALETHHSLCNSHLHSLQCFDTDSSAIAKSIRPAKSCFRSATDLSLEDPEE